MNLAEKMISRETVDRLLAVISNKSWEEKKLLADKLIAILDASNGEEEILERIHEIK